MTSLVKEHFFSISDHELSKQLFKLSVVRTVIETSSFCNRRCAYCPNARIDRLSANNYMPSAIMEKVVSGLAEINYDNAIVLHFYNEPLADKHICEHIARFAQACPNANIQLYSNGDYLDVPYLDRLRESGLTALHLSLHLGNDVPWDDAKIISRLTALSVRIGLPAIVEIFVPQIAIQARFPDSKIDIRLLHKNYPIFGGTSRAGSVPNMSTVKADEAACLIPFNELNIAWDGSIIPCCEIHPDVAEHQKYKIGNLNDYPDIYSAFSSSTLVNWRRSQADPRGQKAPCDACPMGSRDPHTIKLLREAFSTLVEPELAD